MSKLLVFDGELDVFFEEWYDVYFCEKEERIDSSLHELGECEHVIDCEYGFLFVANDACDFLNEIIDKLSSIMSDIHVVVFNLLDER